MTFRFVFVFTPFPTRRNLVILGLSDSDLGNPAGYRSVPYHATSRQPESIDERSDRLREYRLDAV